MSISLFNLLRFPLSVFPSVISASVEASVSFSRLYNFLMSEELEDSIQHETPTAPINERIVVENGEFAWDPEAASVLSELNFKVLENECLAIVGSVGAGKSSLLSALLGDTYKVQGQVTLRGSLAYVPQTAWIMNASVKDNILFGCSFDESFYHQVLEDCGLVPDLEMLPLGDETEIGERGINLSGGQKQRISIARAVYSRADIYLLDDPLSAVDAHVGKHIFDRVFGPKGLLKNKARILVTHGIHFLPDVDRVMVLKQGKVVEYGTYKELNDAKQAFYALVREYGKRKDDSKEEMKRSDTKESLGEIPMTPVKSAKDVTKKSSDGKLISKEESAKGSVDWSVYTTYAESCSWSSVLFYLFVAVLSQALSVFQNVYLAWWADANDRMVNAGDVNFLPWLLGYGGLGLLYSFAVVFQTIFIWIFCGIKSARELHAKLLENILRVPQSFFDTTPLGRIMNRFTKDQYTVDEVLPRSFDSYFRTLFSVISVLAINAIGNPFYIVFAIPLAYLYAYFQRYYLCTSRELKRLDSVSRSPIYAHFQETLCGVSTIRAFAKSDRFIKTNESRIDYNQQAYYPSVSSNRWLAVRLEFLGSLIVFGSAIFGVLSIYFKMELSSSVIGLMLTYSLTYRYLI